MSSPPYIWLIFLTDMMWSSLLEHHICYTKLTHRACYKMVKHVLRLTNWLTSHGTTWSNSYHIHFFTQYSMSLKFNFWKLLQCNSQSYKLVPCPSNCFKICTLAKTHWIHIVWPCSTFLKFHSCLYCTLFLSWKSLDFSDFQLNHHNDFASNVIKVLYSNSCLKTCNSVKHIAVFSK